MSEADLRAVFRSRLAAVWDELVETMVRDSFPTLEKEDRVAPHATARPRPSEGRKIARYGFYAVA